MGDNDFSKIPARKEVLLALGPSNSQLMKTVVGSGITSLSDLITEDKRAVATTSWPGKAKKMINLVPKLIAAGRTGEAINMCNDVIGRSGVANYFKAAAWAYLGIAYMNNINDGITDPTVNNLNVAKYYCDIGYICLLDPTKVPTYLNRRASSSEDELGGGVDTSSQGAASNEPTNYHLAMLAMITSGKVMAERRLNADTDSAIAKIFDSAANMGVNLVADDNGTKEEKQIGIDYLRTIAKIEKASLDSDSQDLAKLAAARELLIKAKKELESQEGRINGIPGYRDKLGKREEKSPTNGFDYYKTLMLIADIAAKEAIISGDQSKIKDLYITKIDGNEKKMSAIDIYKLCEKKGHLGTGSYPDYISAWAKLSRINYAMAFDSLEEIYKTEKNPNVDKNTAIRNSIADLEAIRTNRNIPKNKFLGCQLALAEASLRLMKLDPGDGGQAESLLKDAIGYSDPIPDKVAKADIQARLYLAYARAIMLNPETNKVEPKFVISVAKKALEKIAMAKQLAKSVEDETKNSADKKKMDVPFNIELLYTEGSLKAQVALANKALAEEAEEQGVSGTAYRTQCDELISSAKENYIAAYKLFADPENKSNYDRTVRPNVILRELIGLEASMVDIRPKMITSKTLDALSDIKEKLDNIGKYAKSNGLKMADDPQGRDEVYIEARTNVEKINVLSKMIYCISNHMNMDDASSFFGKNKTDLIKEYHGEIVNLAKADCMKALSEGEKKYVYMTAVSASMVALGYTENKDARKIMLGVIKDYCLRSLDVKNIEDVETKAQFALKKGATWIMPYEIGDALLMIGMIDKGKKEGDALIEAVKKHCVQNLIAKFEGVLKGRIDASLRERTEDRLAKLYFMRGNISNWATKVKNSADLKPGEIKEFESAKKDYDKAIKLGLAKKNLNVLVNNRIEIEFKLAAGKKATTDKEILARLDKYLAIAKGLNAIIAMGDENGNPTDATLKDTHSKLLNNRAAILKAISWKAILLTSVGEYARKNAFKQKVVALTGVNEINSCDLSKKDGVEQAQKALFNAISNIYAGLKISIEDMRSKYKISERGMGDYGISMSSFYKSMGTSYAILAIFMNDTDTDSKASDALKKAVKLSEEDTLEWADANIALANLLTWRDLGVVTARENYEKAIKFYLDNKIDISMSDMMGYAQCLAMNVYTNNDASSARKELVSGKVIKGGVLPNILNSSDKTDISWTYANLTMADMALSDESTDIRKAGNDKEKINAVLANQIKATKYALDVLANAKVKKAVISSGINKADHQNTIYGTMIMETDMAIKAYTKELVKNIITNENAPYFKNREVIRDLAILMVCQGRLITSIPIEELQANKKSYQTVLTEANANLSLTLKLLEDIESKGLFPAGQFKREIKAIADWIGYLEQSGSQNLGM